MLFGNPAIYAVEAYNERLPGCEMPDLLGRMCHHIQGRAFGDIAEAHCSLDHAFEELEWHAEHSEDLWDDAFTGLSDFDVYELLDIKLYRDDGQTLEEMRTDSNRFSRFNFLNNTGEQFDSTPKRFIIRCGSDLRVLWRDLQGEQQAVEVPVSEFVSVTREASLWYRQQRFIPRARAMGDKLKALCDEADKLELHGLSRELTLRQLQLDPDDCVLLLDLASHEKTFCRYQEAEAALAHAERVSPPEARKWILARRSFLSGARGNLDGSLRYHLAAHALDPDDATFLVYAACASFKTGNTEDAIEYATRATRCPRGCIEEAHFNLGGYLLAMRRFSEARDCYLSALEIDPDYKIARTRLEDVSRILALGATSAPPATDDALKALCDEADELGLAGLSRELTLRRLELDPDDFVRLIVLACHELTFCRYEEARAATDHAERVCPPWGVPHLLGQRGLLSEATGTPDASLQYHLAAHDAEPDKANFLINAADIAFNTGDTERAIEYATRATRCPKGSIDGAYLNLGHYMLAMRRFPEARNCYFKALEINPDCEAAWDRLDEISRILALEAESYG